MKKSILITGAGGFIGRHVAKHYSELGWHVVGLGRAESALPDYAEWGISTWIPLSLGSRTTLSFALEPNAIIHCAGGSNVGKSMAMPQQDFDDSIISLQCILEYLRTSAPKCSLVYPSSAAVYGATGNSAIRETDSGVPISVYGDNKVICEQLIKSYAKHFSLNAAVVRLFSVYGPELRKQIMWDACVKADSGLTEFGGTGVETRDFLHVEDTARLFEVARSVASTACPIINGGTGIPTRIKDLVTMIFEHFGGGLKPQFSQSQRAGDPQHFQADITRATNAGWAPSRPLDQGVREYVDWFKSVYG